LVPVSAFKAVMSLGRARVPETISEPPLATTEGVLALFIRMIVIIGELLEISKSPGVATNRGPTCGGNRLQNRRIAAETGLSAPQTWCLTPPASV